MFKISGQVGIGVAAQVQILLQVYPLTTLGGVTGVVGIPVANSGTYAENVGRSQRSGCQHGGAYCHHQFTHITPVCCRLLYSVELDAQTTPYFFVGFDHFTKTLAEAVFIHLFAGFLVPDTAAVRSEERRVGKGCRSPWSTDHQEKR